MASLRNVSPVPISDERSPLLGHDEPQYSTNAASSEDADVAPKEQGKPPSPWRYAFYALWAFLAIVIIALFVKGWIDADDVDVCCFSLAGNEESLNLTIMQFDLKGALKRALGGGLSGAAAMVLQVLLLMVCTPNLVLRTH